MDKNNHNLSYISDTLQPTASYEYATEAYMNETYATTVSIILNGTLCNIHVWVRGPCRSVLVSKGVQQTAQPLCLIRPFFWGSRAGGGGVTYSEVLPLPPFHIRIEGKTMAAYFICLSGVTANMILG